MKDIHIPPEAVEAAARAIASPYDWELGDSMWRMVVRRQATAAIRAMLAAWPGMQRRIHIEQAIILPLPEPRDSLRPDRRTNVAERLFGDD